LQADDQLEQHALAGAAAPEDGQSFSTGHGQIDPTQYDLATERLMYASQNQRGCVSLSGAFYGSGAALLRCKQEVLFRHHEKNTRMNFTRMTSARMTKSEDRTTELVAESPTPAVPPRVRIP